MVKRVVKRLEKRVVKSTTGPTRMVMTESDAAISLCDKICNNDPSIITFYFDNVASALRDCYRVLLSSFNGNNTHLTKVVLDGPSVQRWLSQNKLNELVEHFGHCQGLEHLEITAPPNYSSIRIGLWATTLTRLLQRRTPLQTLVVECLLTIIPDELDDLTKALHQHPTLRRVELSRILTPVSYPHQHSSVTETTLCLNPLLQTMATIPNLTHLQLVSNGYWDIQNANGHKETVGIFSSPSCADSLAALLELPHLETLVLRNVGFNDTHAQRLATCLTHNRTLRRLDLRCNPHLTADGQQQLIDAVVADHCNLHHLDLDWHIHTTGPTLLARALFHQRLNRMGRASFLHDSAATHQERVEVLVCSNKEPRLDMTWFLLLQNPLILSACRRDHEE